MALIRHQTGWPGFNKSELGQVSGSCPAGFAVIHTHYHRWRKEVLLFHTLHTFSFAYAQLPVLFLGPGVRESLWAHLMVDLQQISINGWRRDAKVLHLSQLPVNAITYQEGLLSHSTQCAGTERNWQRGILCCFTDIPRRGRHQAATIILAGRRQ